MIWLGESRGYLTDHVTQRWVQVTGRTVDLGEHPWLAGPVGDVHGIGREFFAEFARREGLELRQGADSGERGLISDFAALAAPDFDPGQVDPSVVGFYARTSAYEFDAWAEWRSAFRPFGRLLGHLFSRRLQQLNVPLSALDTSRGVTSDVVQLVEPATGEVRHTAWVRELLGTGDVLYAGDYSLAAVPGRRGRCVKALFPLPNGNAIVVLRPEVHADGSLSLVSAGERFGDPGFYFTVHDGRGRVRARYVRAMQERMRVYPAEHGAVRADHVLTLWGATFLRMHYRLRARGPAADVLAS
ncbi:MAG TPA: hypothetical protein VF710_16735 [Longimicrobium sp.]